jgi:hypothetical protein
MARHTVANRFLTTFIPPKCQISAKHTEAANPQISENSKIKTYSKPFPKTNNSINSNNQIFSIINQAYSKSNTGTSNNQCQ